MSESRVEILELLPAPKDHPLLRARTRKSLALFVEDHLLKCEVANREIDLSRAFTLNLGTDAFRELLKVKVSQDGEEIGFSCALLGVQGAFNLKKLIVSPELPAFGDASPLVEVSDFIPLLAKLRARSLALGEERWGLRCGAPYFKEETQVLTRALEKADPARGLLVHGPDARQSLALWFPLLAWAAAAIALMVAMGEKEELISAIVLSMIFCSPIALFFFARLRSVHVKVDGKEVHIRHTPFAMKNKCYDGAGFKDVFSRASLKRGFFRQERFDVAALKEDNRSLWLMTGLKKRERALQLERYISHGLGMPDTPVFGELRRERKIAYGDPQGLAVEIAKEVPDLVQQEESDLAARRMLLNQLEVRAIQRSGELLNGWLRWGEEGLSHGERKRPLENSAWQLSRMRKQRRRTGLALLLGRAPLLEDFLLIELRGQDLCLIAKVDIQLLSGLSLRQVPITKEVNGEAALDLLSATLQSGGHIII